MTSAEISVKEVCAILRSCHRLKVKRFKFKDLEFAFDLDGVPHVKPLVPLPPRDETAVTAGAMQLLDERGRAELELARQDEARALLAIEDPLAYERLLLSEDAAELGPDEQLGSPDE